jgi:hypothetical protein
MALRAESGTGAYAESIYPCPDEAAGDLAALIPQERDLAGVVSVVVDGSVQQDV